MRSKVRDICVSKGTGQPTASAPVVGCWVDPVWAGDAAVSTAAASSSTWFDYCILVRKGEIIHTFCWLVGWLVGSVQVVPLIHIPHTHNSSINIYIFIYIYIYIYTYTIVYPVDQCDRGSHSSFVSISQTAMWFCAYNRLGDLMHSVSANARVVLPFFRQDGRC